MPDRRTCAEAAGGAKGHKNSPPPPRMNPPRKVGARSALPGFRINGREFPFHGQCRAPFKKASVHRCKRGGGASPEYTASPAQSAVLTFADGWWTTFVPAAPCTDVSCATACGLQALRAFTRLVETARIGQVRGSVNSQPHKSNRNYTNQIAATQIKSQPHKSNARHELFAFRALFCGYNQVSAAFLRQIAFCAQVDRWISAAQGSVLLRRKFLNRGYSSKRPKARTELPLPGVHKARFGAKNALSRGF